jgi:hypothetical protein
MTMDEMGVSGEQLGCGIRIERKTDSMEDQQIEAEGRLEEMDDVGFRRLYGTEWALLDEEEEEVAYALKSDAEDLGEYVGQHIWLSGFLVEGFPVEAGEPGYISVMEIEEAYYSE